AAFREHGITYQASERDRSAQYIELLPLINSGRVRLLQDPELLREFRGLERRRGATRDRVDHRPGAFDDRAVAATVALVRAHQAASSMDHEFIMACLSVGDGVRRDWRPPDG